MNSRFFPANLALIFLMFVSGCSLPHHNIKEIYRSESHGSIGNLIWSHDGNILAFMNDSVSSAKYEIGFLKRTPDNPAKYKVDLKTQADFLNISDETWKYQAGYSINSWSPDDKHLVMSSRTGIEFVSIDDGHTVFFHEGYYANWSPDGKKLAILEHSPKSETSMTDFVGIYNWESKIYKQIYSVGMPSYTDITKLSWPPDTSKIAFSVITGPLQADLMQEDIVVLDLSTNQPLELTSANKGQRFFSPVWLSHDNLLAFLHTDEAFAINSALSIMDLDNKCLFEIDKLGYVSEISWSPKTQEFFFPEHDKIFSLSIKEAQLDKGNCIRPTTSP